MEEGESARTRRRTMGGAAEDARARLVALGVEMGTLTGRFASTTGLHPTDVRALWVLAEPDAPRTAGELGGRLDLSSAAATRTVDRLERLGYVERVRDADDRRRVGLRLTEEAQAVTGAFFGRVSSVAEEAIEGFAEAELEVVARFLARMQEAVRTHTDDAGWSPTTIADPAQNHE